MRVSKSLLRASSAVIAAAILSGCVAESRADRSSGPVRSRVASLRVAPSQPTLAPLEFVSFCMRHSEECRPSGSTGVIRATDRNIALIASVNRKVNAAIRPSNGTSAWRIAPADGNCNDYVVTKRHELLNRGFPSSALLISVVKTANGEGHLVLLAKTDYGDLVLDNLSQELLGVAETPYSWIKRQIPEDPQRWETA